MLVDVRLGQMAVHLVEIGRRQQGANAEQVPLDWNEYFVNARHRLDRARHADGSVQLVDIAVSFDAGVVLRNSAAAKKTCVTGVAGLGVDLHVGEIYDAPPSLVFSCSSAAVVSRETKKRGIMAIHRTLLVLALTTLSLPACRRAPSSLADVDRDMIRTAVNDLTKAMLVGDFATAASYYSEDAEVLPPNAPAIQGRAAIQSFFSSYPKISAMTQKIVKLE